MSYEYTFQVSDKKIMVSTETMQMKSLSQYFNMMPFVLQNS